MPLLQDDLFTTSFKLRLDLVLIVGFHMISRHSPCCQWCLTGIKSFKQRVYLADGLDDNDKLSEEAMLRGLSALSLLLKGYRDFQQKMSLCRYTYVTGC